MSLINFISALLLFLMNSSLIIVNCDRMTEKIYENIEVESFCFRRLNATHQTGCTSDLSGNVGVIHVVESEDDILWVTQNGPHFPYIAAIPEEYFTTGNLTKIKLSKRVSGVLVLKSSNMPVYPKNAFSPEKSCPNDNFGLYMNDKYPEYSHCKKGEWVRNNVALGMLYEDWGIPIVLVANDTQVDFIKHECFERFNIASNQSERTWPLCAAEISSFMFAAKDSPTCMRRSTSTKNLNPTKYCEPLGGRNIISFLQPTNKSVEIENRSIILISARIDAVSMFDKISPGGDSAISGLVSLLSIAQTLSKLREEISQIAPNKNVLFAIFNGETFDYIGSSRTVFDMERGVFPQELNADWTDQLANVNLSHISHYIELGQVALHDDEERKSFWFRNEPITLESYLGYNEDDKRALWMHTDPISTADPNVNSKVEDLINKLKLSAGGLNLKKLYEKNALPPASIQRFLRKDSKIASVFISNHKKVFTNKFFMSQYDIDQYMSRNTAALIANLSSTVSKVVYQLMTDKTKDDIATDVTMVDDLLECYMRNASCRLFREVENPIRLPYKIFQSEPFPLYVGVDRDNQYSAITYYTRYLMAYFTGQQLLDRDSDNCTAQSHDKIFNYDWMVGPNLTNPGICYRSIAKLTSAVSPAAYLNDWESTEYSTWTESIWTQVTLRIFVRPSPSLEGLTLGLGFAIFISSLLFVYSVNKRSSVLFGPRALMAC